MKVFKEGLKDFVVWFCITFTATVSLLAIIPIGINGESALELEFPKFWWAVLTANVWLNLIHFTEPRTQ
jgi:hypothetical protein